MRIPSSSGGAGKMEVKRGPWTAEEDELLIGYIEREGEGRWRTLPKQAGLLRCGKSCRLRWKNYLRPTIKRGQITSDEEDLILRLHRLLGNRWSLIAGRIPGRTDNDIKNYWNSHLSKKLMKQGIDPKTHKPFHPKSSIVSSPGALHSSVSNLFYAPLTSDQDHVIMIKNEDGDLEQDLGIRSDEMINCFTDEAFSAFLNSLINEDHRLDYQHEDEQE